MYLYNNYSHTHYAHYLGRPQDGNIIGLWVHELLKSNIDETEKKIHEKNEIKNASKKNSKNNNKDTKKRRIDNELAVNNEVMEGNIIEKGIVDKGEIKIEKTPIKEKLYLENDCCNRITDINIGSYNCGEEYEENDDVNAKLKSKNEIEIDNIIDNINKNNSNANFCDNEGVHVIVDDDSYESSWNCFYLSKLNKENKRISCVVS
jgi:hypothetical protein